MKPSIAIDASFANAFGGIGTYSWKLLEYLSYIDSAKDVLLLENTLPASNPLFRHSQQKNHSRLTTLPQTWNTVTTSNRLRFYWILITLPKLLRQYNPKIYHALDGMAIPQHSLSMAKILTMHDIIPITHPQYSRFRDSAVARYYMPNAMKKADAIITNSYFTAHQIIGQFPFWEPKIRTIYFGVDKNFFSPPQNKIEVSLKYYKEFELYSPNYFFTVVTMNPRRNLSHLLIAFERFVETTGDREFCLVIAGSRGWKDQPILKQIQNHPYSQRIHLTGPIADSTLVELYQGSYLFVFVSLLEGFGFPVLEAMACGTPVICSNTSALKEIAGEGGSLVDPNNIDELAYQFERLTTNSQGYDELQSKGTSRAKEFDWETTARKTWELYNEFL